MVSLQAKSLNEETTPKKALARTRDLIEFFLSRTGKKQLNLNNFIDSVKGTTNLSVDDEGNDALPKKSVHNCGAVGCLAGLAPT